MRELARAIGRSHTAVQKWRDEGLLPLDAKGRILRAGGMEAARAQLDGAASREDDRQALRQVKLELARARRDKEQAIAELRKLEAAHVAGRFISVEDVRRDAAATCGAIRAGLLNLPDRVVLTVEALCASLTGAPRAAAIQQAIEGEVNLLLEHLHASRMGAG